MWFLGKKICDLNEKEFRYFCQYMGITPGMSILVYDDVGNIVYDGYPQPKAEPEDIFSSWIYE